MSSLAAKRGDSHIDVIISLAIFILFLSWFFAFIQPQYASFVGQKTALSTVESALSAAYWEVQQVPLFIYSNSSGKMPIVVKFPFGWGEHNMRFLPKRDFALLRGRLFFLGSPAESPFLLTYSNWSTNKSVTDCGLYYSDESVTSLNVRADFSGQILKSLQYDGAELVRDFLILLNEEELGFENSSMEDRGFIVLNKFESEESYVLYVFFCNSSAMFIMAGSSSEKNIKLKFAPVNMTHYYINNEFNGPLSELTDGLLAGNVTSLFIYENISGRGFELLSEDAFSVEHYSSNFEIASNGTSMIFWIVPFRENYSGNEFETLFGYNYSFGVIRRIRGLNPYYFSKANLFKNELDGIGEYYLNISCPSLNYFEGNLKESDLKNIYAASLLKYAVFSNGSLERCVVHEGIAK
ncbi:MAG: hypothetical protein QXT20_02915 [Candidatus Woesearchaeota archaeon]